MPVSLWICPEHGLTGPTGCCGKASYAQIAVTPATQWKTTLSAPPRPTEPQPFKPGTGMRHPDSCDGTPGGQCPWVNPSEADHILFCGLKRGHGGPHRDAYGYEQDFWIRQATDDESDAASRLARALDVLHHYTPTYGESEGGSQHVVFLHKKLDRIRAILEERPDAR